MTSIITLFTIIASLMSPIDVKPAYYQEYNLVGEMPDMSVSSINIDNNITSVIMMPEIVVTAPRPVAKVNSIEFPEIVVSAPRINPAENMTGVVMMPEIIVTAEKLTPANTDIVTKRPTPGFDYPQSSVNNFYLYALIAVLTVLFYAWASIFLPRIGLRPIFVTIGRAQSKRHHHSIERKRQ